LDRELLELAARILDERDNDLPMLYRDGLTELLPEFHVSEAAQQAARIMEETALLTTIMSEFGAQGIGDVQVVIAGDGRRDDVRHLSMVLSRYGVAGGTMGALAVLGPTRMRYERAISVVRVVAGVMSNLLVAGYGYGLDSGEKSSSE
jgi:heat-inducible transcriptional repressor